MRRRRRFPVAFPYWRAISSRERREADLFYADLLGRSPTSRAGSARTEQAAAGGFPTMLGTEAEWWPAAAGAVERKKKVNAFFIQLKADVKSIGFQEDLKGVQLLDMWDHRQHHDLQMFTAWTNSATEIYVNFDKLDELAAQLKAVPGVTNPRRAAELVYATLVIRHELNHVAQFKDPRKGPPASTAAPYKQMCEYEKEAYAKDADWTKAKVATLKAVGLTDEVIAAVFPDEKTISDDFSRIANLEGGRPTKNAEDKRKAEMIRKGHLPAHDKMADLYRAK